jgi:hypothetical protein
MKVVRYKGKYQLSSKEFNEDLTGKYIFSPDNNSGSVIDSGAYSVFLKKLMKDDMYEAIYTESINPRESNTIKNPLVKWSSTVDKYDYFLCDTEEDLALLMLKYGWHDGG